MMNDEEIHLFFFFFLSSILNRKENNLLLFMHDVIYSETRRKCANGLF